MRMLVGGMVGDEVKTYSFTSVRLPGRTCLEENRQISELRMWNVRDIPSYNGNEFVEHLCDSIYDLNGCGVFFLTVAIAEWVEI